MFKSNSEKQTTYHLIESLLAHYVQPEHAGHNVLINDTRIPTIRSDGVGWQRD